MKCVQKGKIGIGTAHHVILLFLMTAIFSSCSANTHSQRLNLAVSSPVPPDQENAARYYEAAAQAIVPLEEGFQKQSSVLDQIVQNGWASETSALAAKLLEDSDFALAVFQRGTEIPAADFEALNRGRAQPQTVLPYPEFKLLTTMLLVKAKQMESAGQSASAVHLYSRALQFVYHLGQDPQTISKVTALALEKNIDFAVNQAAEKKILDRHDRDALKENLLRFQKARFRASSFVDAEQVFFLEMVNELAGEAGTDTAAKEFPSQRLIQKAGQLSGQYNEYWRQALETNAAADWEKAETETKLLKIRADLSFPSIAEITGRLLANTISGKTEETQDQFLDQTVTYLYVTALPNYQKMSDLYQDAFKRLDATIQLLD